MIDIGLLGLRLLTQILDAGNAITAFSLLLYALTFNLRERAARTFALLLACLALIYFGDVMASLAGGAPEHASWLRLVWVGISLLPSAYLHLSDALLAATGRPSRGRRHLVIRLAYLVSGSFILAVGFSSLVVGPLTVTEVTSYLLPGPFLPVYLLFLAATLSMTAYNLVRAYKRCLTRASRRRMRYLLAGAVAPILGSFPFILVLPGVAVAAPKLWWAAQSLVNVTVAVLLVLMAYSVAFFGVSYPDRVVKSRLFQWILRGPVVASSVLAVTVVVNRLGVFLGLENSRAVPFAMVSSLLLLQYLITLIRLPVERWLFYGEDREDVSRLHLLEERLLTTGDLRQFLEAVLNAACDVTGARSAFVAAVGAEGLDLEVAVGPDDPLRGGEELPHMLVAQQRRELEGLGSYFRWDHYLLVPLRGQGSERLIGLFGLWSDGRTEQLSGEQAAALGRLANRAEVALTDRLLQREVFGAVDRLVPQVDEIQRLRAAARYEGTQAFSEGFDVVRSEADLVNMVREALGHYWGGPRLAKSPLLGLRVVRLAAVEQGGSAVNGLRSILREGIERVRPEGERRFTADWMLYNILEMKFLEGRKVRDVALRLAMSEADLYRKQRVAIEAVAGAIARMEREASQADGGTGRG